MSLPTNLPNSSVGYHPSAAVEVEVYDRKGNKLTVRSVYMTFGTVVVRLSEELDDQDRLKSKLHDGKAG